MQQDSMEIRRNFEMKITKSALKILNLIFIKQRMRERIIISENLNRGRNILQFFDENNNFITR